MKLVSLLSLAVAACALAAPASAETVRLRADLAARNEVPANTSAGRGNLQATLDTATRVLSWRLEYEGLTGPSTMMHFHGPAEAGTNAGVVVPIPSSPADSSIVGGDATLTPEQMADLLAGKWYANIHTQANPGGEIRGQVTRVRARPRAATPAAAPAAPAAPAAAPARPAAPAAPAAAPARPAAPAR
jgi:hypothetical protein